MNAGLYICLSVVGRGGCAVACLDFLSFELGAIVVEECDCVTSLFLVCCLNGQVCGDLCERLVPAIEQHSPAGRGVLVRLGVVVRGSSAVACLDFLSLELGAIVVEESNGKALFFLICRLDCQVCGDFCECLVPAIEEHRPACRGVLVRLGIVAWSSSAVACLDFLSLELGVVVVEESNGKALFFLVCRLDCEV